MYVDGHTKNEMNRALGHLCAHIDGHTRGLIKYIYGLEHTRVLGEGPYSGKWHVLVSALLYLFECLNG